MAPDMPAGWYAAPHANNELRYWDGMKWLDIAPPPPQAAAVTAQAPVVAPKPPAAAPAQPAPRRYASNRDKPFYIAPSSALDDPALKPKRRRVAAPIIALVLFIGAIGFAIAVSGNPDFNVAAAPSVPTETPGSVAEGEEPKEVKPILPFGFVSIGGGLGGRWTDQPCSLSMGGCNHMEVYSPNGCPNSLYVELNVLDSAGRVIGYTNDAVGSVGAAQKALLEFSYFEDGASKVEVSEVSCY